MKGVAFLLVAVGAWLWVPATSRSRLALPRPGSSRFSAPDLAAAVAGLAVALLVGGFAGILAGVAVGVAARTGLRRIGPDDKPRRDALARQAPDAVDCLASCLAAGAPLWSAMQVVGEAFGEPIAGMLTRSVQRHAMGSPASETFAQWISEPVLAPVGRLLVRSSESGGSLTSSLVACAQRMRQERAGELELRARAVGVKAVAPLGVCFLPAFVLLAVVPIVGSMLRTLF